MTNKTGGPAFPTTKVLPASGGEVSDGNGMSLRDYFAAKAMQALIAGSLAGSHSWGDSTTSREAYSIADAMLKAREK